MNNWETEKIGILCNTYAGGTPNRGNDSYYNGDIPWISSGEVNQTAIYQTKEFITEKGLKMSSAKWIPADAILIAMYGATAGQVSKLKIKATSNQAVLAVIPHKDDIDFFFYQLNQIKEKILYLAQGSGQPNLSKSLIDETYISLPNKVEQQKIAKILNTIDGVIEKTEKAITKYQAIKKGMMHDLFTRGIDVKTGQLRPSFNDAPALFKESTLGMIPIDWEVNPLSKLGIIKSGIDYKSNPKGDEYPIYGTGGIMGRTSKYLNSGPAVLTGRKGTINNPLYIEGKFWNVDTIFCINSINLKEVDIKWLFYYFRNTDLTKLNEATGVPSVNSSSLYKLKFKTPLFKEQQEITLRLSKIDLLIEREIKSLKKHEKVKKGLMQDLLTGKVEVTI